MAEPMNYQQALESGATQFWGKTQHSGWYPLDIHDVGDVKDLAEGYGDHPPSEPLIYQFLPIPTPEELLSEVEVEVVSEFNGKPGVTLAGHYGFKKGDRVRVRKVKW